MYKITGGPKEEVIEDIRVPAEDVEVSDEVPSGPGASSSVDTSNAGRLRSRAAELRAQRTGKATSSPDSTPGASESEGTSNTDGGSGSRKKAGGKAAAARKRKLNKK